MFIYGEPRLLMRQGGRPTIDMEGYLSQFTWQAPS